VEEREQRLPVLEPGLSLLLSQLVPLHPFALAWRWRARNNGGEGVYNGRGSGVYNSGGAAVQVGSFEEKAEKETEGARKRKLTRKGAAEKKAARARD